jgi:hypothetical protein
VDPGETPNGSGLEARSDTRGEYTLAALTSMPLQEFRAVWRRALGEEAPERFKTKREDAAQSLLNKVTSRAAAPAAERDASNDPVDNDTAGPVPYNEPKPKRQSTGTRKPAPDLTEAQRKARRAMPENPRPGSSKYIFMELFRKATARGKSPEEVRDDVLAKMIEHGVSESTARTVVTDYYTQVLGLRRRTRQGA